MPTTIKLRNSVTTTSAPSSLVQGEVAINITDKKVWVGNAATTPIQLLGAGASGTFGALTCTSLTNSGLTSGRVTYASTGGLLTDSANMTFNGTTLTVADLTDSSLTANRVVYATTAGNLTTSANLTFNGTTLTTANDASISGLTVGRGGGAVSTNTAVGYQAINGSATGTANTALGYQAGLNNTTGAQNTFVGHQAGKTNTTSSQITAIGNNALTNVTGNQNTAIGANAGSALTSGNYNLAVGDYALFRTTTPSSNTAVGSVSLYENTTGANNTALGNSALQNNTTASNNTAVGYQAGYSNTTGAFNDFFGIASGYSNTTGTNISAFGSYVLNKNTTGVANIAMGGSGTIPALYNNTTGSYNVGLGTGALFSNTTRSNHTAVGYQALYSNTGNDTNTAVGYQALYSNTTGGVNVALGSQAGYNNTSANYGTFLGYQAGFAVTTGGSNTFIGDRSGNAITTGSKNSILGSYSGNQGGLDIRTASNYIVLSDGDGSPRLISDNNGNITIGTTNTDPATNNVVGICLEGPVGSGKFSRDSNPGLDVNRKTNDGTLVRFFQDGTVEGTISVSGTTVSYNGGHLSRYSQLPNNQKDDTILKGTVMSNLDDMCVWTKNGEVLPNEQLNKMKVSDVEGDTNVAGVFVSWDYDEQSQSDDMNVAMTGDMIIRIAQGVVVQKGDLLMSAGDGTAKPQGDDIRRSKTVAKVTSNHVTCTYEDGSYCVPCVLMAC